MLLSIKNAWLNIILPLFLTVGPVIWILATLITWVNQNVLLTKVLKSQLLFLGRLRIW